MEMNNDSDSSKYNDIHNDDSDGNNIAIVSEICQLEL